MPTKLWNQSSNQMFFFSWGLNPNILIVYHCILLHDPTSPLAEFKWDNICSVEKARVRTHRRVHARTHTHAHTSCSPSTEFLLSSLQPNDSCGTNNMTDVALKIQFYCECLFDWTFFHFLVSLVTIWSLDGSEFPSSNSNPFLHLGTIWDKEVKKRENVSGLIYRIILRVKSTFTFLWKDNFSTVVLLQCVWIFLLSFPWLIKTKRLA